MVDTVAPKIQALIDLQSVKVFGTVSADKAHGVLSNDIGALNVDSVSFDHTTKTIAPGGSATLQGTFGKLTINSDGSYKYVSGTGHPLSELKALISSHGLAQDNFTYAADDGHGGTAQSHLTITTTMLGQQYLVGQPGGTLTGGHGNQILDGSLGDQTVKAGNGIAFLIGGPNDTLIAGKGLDVLIGAPNDTLVGNRAGIDFFKFGPGFGLETVQNFSAATDTILFDKSVFDSYAAVKSHMAQVGSDVAITLDSADHVTLQGVSLSHLHASDFHFV